MAPLLLRAAARYHVQHKLQLVLALLGITLGVAVVVSVDVATGSARRAFTLSTEAVSGRATHEITGGPAGIADSVYTRIVRSLPPGVRTAPLIDRYVHIHVAGDSRTMRLLGVDPFAERPFRSFAAGAAGGLDAGQLITERVVLLSAATAAALGIAAGDSVVVQFGTQRATARVAGTLEPDGDLARRAFADLLLADIATAQELTDALGRLDRIELQVPDDADMDALTGILPAGLVLATSGARTGATARLTEAFETNLLALALVALVFGMFLIYNSVSFSVVQRRGLIGLLRAQGVTAREILALILLEGVLLGVVATVLGTLAGRALGAQLVGLVAGTINDLYFAVSVTGVELSRATLIKAALLGVGATLLAALAPAREAALTQPRASIARSVLERRTAASAGRYALAGAGIAVVAAALLLVPSHSIVPGFAGLFTLILAAALVTPGLTRSLMSAITPVAGAAGPVGRMAARGVIASLSRTAPAIAALGVALSVGIAVTLMIASFRSGVVRWLEQTLQADVYISAPTQGANRTDVTLDPALASQVERVPGVAGVSRYRHTTLLLGDDMIRTIAVDLYGEHYSAFDLLESVGDTWNAFHGGAVLVSEPFAFRRGLGAGDSVRLPTAQGGVAVPIAAVFRDYASEHGVIFVHRNRWQEMWNDDAVTALSVFAAPGTDPDELATRLRELPAAAGVTLRPNRGLRESTLQVFDRTFLITGVLRILALLVAFVGVTGALMALQLERSREVGVLRAVGLTPAQVWALATSQTALMGVAAVTLALPLGIAMAWAMVHVINRRSFGWTFDLVFTAPPFLQALLVGITAAVIAGVYPAYRLARMKPVAVLRGE